MPDPFTAFIAGYVATNAPEWVRTLHDTLLDKGKEQLLERGRGMLGEREAERRLLQVLKKAAQRGLARFRKRIDRDQYKNVLGVLFEPGEHSDALRQEVMTLFSLNPTPDFMELDEIYNRSLRTRALLRAAPPPPVHVAPYLVSFFEALIIELYGDPLFKARVRDAIQTRAALLLTPALAEANTTLHQIHAAINPGYPQQQFEQDVARYTAYVEQTLQTLKIIGFLPKDQKQDPEIHGIFVPLRVKLQERAGRQEEERRTIVAQLEQAPHLVLLGAPGSGKSTAARHLAWSHAWSNLGREEERDESVPLLPGCPLPLRIELRLLMQDRKQNSGYSFLSYASEVLLGREGISVHPQMFERLLAERRMLILFDGLDEVTTLDERQRLVQEIEHFVELYPGNRVLVTSRPVGYELAGCSRRLFTHAEVQDFDDEQIHQFLERWYTHVLRLSPLPYQERQELETLFKTLKENTRLHKLAENPLLLTVITALYRSQRLPEKRVQVYDRCAELLLATWAKLKGTDARWSMRLGEEDQFACIAHLGYTLHKRSQEESTGNSKRAKTQETAADVSERVMLREIESFIKEQKLLSEVAEQRKEARSFLNLMQIEAGLIVERGKDENGESIYGFVHRTFQEYFAAADVHKRFTDEEDASVIHDFLVEHLHDPHWREVILLLLGKLGRKPVTQRLRQILNGTIKSQRSRYTEIVQQDLFFVADCLIEEIAVENDLPEHVASLLGKVALTSPFSSQKQDALDRLSKLMQTRQCASVAEKEFKQLLAQDRNIDSSLRIEVAEVLDNNRPLAEDLQRLLLQSLLSLTQEPDLAIEQRIQAFEVLYYTSFEDSQEEKLATQSLLSLTQEPSLTIEQRIQAYQALYRSSFKDSQEEKLAIQSLLSLVQELGLTIEQRIQAFEVLNYSSLEDSQKEKLAIQCLLSLVQEPSLTIEQHIQAIEAPYLTGLRSPQARQLATQTLLSLAQESHLTFEQRVQTLHFVDTCNTISSIYNTISYQEQQLAVQSLLSLAQEPSITIEQRIRAYQTLYQCSYGDSQEEKLAIQFLLSLAQEPSLTMEQRTQAYQALYQSSRVSSQEHELATQSLLSLAQEPHFTIEQRIHVVQEFYQNSLFGDDYKKAAQLLWSLTQSSQCTRDQHRAIITLPIENQNANYVDKAWAIQELKARKLVDDLADYVEKRWRSSRRSDLSLEEIPVVATFAQDPLFSSRVRDQLYQVLRASVQQFNGLTYYD